MASIRMTNDMRENLVRKVVKDVFKERDEQLVKQENTLAEACWKYAYGKYADQMYALPPGAFNYSTYFHPTFHEPDNLSKNYRGLALQFGRVEGDNSARISKPEFYGDRAKQYIPNNHELCTRHRSYTAEMNDLAEDKKQLKEELAKLMKPCTTLLKLRLAWPAGEKWINEIEPPPPPPVIVNTTKLNEIICSALGPEEPACL